MQIDVTKQYRIPMVKLHQLADSAQYMNVKIDPHYKVRKGKKQLVCIRVYVDNPEYEELWFAAEYFDYLLNVSHYIRFADEPAANSSTDAEQGE